MDEGSPRFHRRLLEARHRGHRIGSAVTGIEYYQIDLGIAMEHMVLKATELGLGTCWIGWFREEKIKEILGIPGSSQGDGTLTWLSGIRGSLLFSLPEHPIQQVPRPSSVAFKTMCSMAMPRSIW